MNLCESKKGTTMILHIRIVFLTLILATYFPPTFGNPRISIITSIYNGDEFMEGFLQDITKQTIFNECELILINANSPGNEFSIIEPYLRQYSNIIYISLDNDPGLYAVWNIGIQASQGKYITNANLDDRRNPNSIEIQAQALDDNPEIDLIYSAYYITYTPNEQFKDHIETTTYKCEPGPQPMWRKSMHEKYGYFRDDFLYAGDWEMWERAKKGGAQFKKIDVISGLYYMNPDGLSTTCDATKAQKRMQEIEYVIHTFNPKY